MLVYNYWVASPYKCYFLESYLPCITRSTLQKNYNILKSKLRNNKGSNPFFLGFNFHTYYIITHKFSVLFMILFLSQICVFYSALSTYPFVFISNLVCTKANTLLKTCFNFLKHQHAFFPK